MVAPLYDGIDIPFKKPEEAHSGLWFDRFFNRYDTNWDIKDTAKPEWIKSMSGPVGQTGQLADFIKRQFSLVKQLHGTSQRYTTDWHFVTGMGNSHPVENGFSWHPTLAVPYIAGSAVKGLVRAWVELNEDKLLDDDKAARLKSWFGTEKKDDVAEQAGDFIFFDAIPEQRPSLIADIMTPHMGKWYSDGDENRDLKPEALPADWHEPIPVTFLAVKQAQFIFSIAPRKVQQQTQLTEVFKALEQALEWLGAGAKTGAGYGYMTQDDSFSKEMDEVLTKYNAELAKQTMSVQQQAISKVREDFTEKQKLKNHNERVGGSLYNSFNALVKDVKGDVDGVWSDQDKKDLRELGNELLRFVGTNNKKIKDVLAPLD
ncbi:MAG: type III-B CRISPR module RAMP protein Cmr6 [Methylococcales bacterium]